MCSGVQIFPTLAEMAGLPPVERCMSALASEEASACTEGALSTAGPNFVPPHTATYAGS